VVLLPISDVCGHWLTTLAPNLPPHPPGGEPTRQGARWVMSAAGMRAVLTGAESLKLREVAIIKVRRGFLRR
jgi:hypothetical protein